MQQHQQAAPHHSEHKAELGVSGLLEEGRCIDIGATALIEHRRQKAEKHIAQAEVRHIGLGVLVEEL